MEELIKKKSPKKRKRFFGTIFTSTTNCQFIRSSAIQKWVPVLFLAFDLEVLFDVGHCATTHRSSNWLAMEPSTCRLIMQHHGRTTVTFWMRRFTTFLSVLRSGYLQI
jgi:hypothetical protein